MIVLDAAIEIVLIALLAFCPLAFGAVEPWSELVAFALGAILAVLVAVRNVIARERIVRWLAHFPIGLYLALVGFQLLPLPSAVVRAISPQTVITRTDLLSDLPNAGELLRSTTPSLYPLGTRHDLSIVLLATTVFFAVTTIFQTPARLRRLLIWIALIGGAIGALALAQDLTRAPGIYWRINIGIAPHNGPFVNHSHYAQFMNLCLGAAMGLLLGSWQPRAEGSKRHIAWWTAPILVIGGVTIALSLTRGGLISMLAAGGVLLAIVSRRSGLRRLGAVVIVVAICTFAGVLYLGFDRIYESARSATRSQAY